MSEHKFSTVQAAGDDFDFGDVPAGSKPPKPTAQVSRHSESDYKIGHVGQSVAMPKTLSISYHSTACV